MKKVEGRMIRLILILALAASTSGCCVGFATKVQNKSGKDLWITMGYTPEADSLVQPVMIPSGSFRLCSGVIAAPGFTNRCVISDDHFKYVYADVSPIGNLKWPLVSSSRFTSSFPCLRFTHHIQVDTNMSLRAVGLLGKYVPQPSGFPIRFTRKEEKN
jgi:hypothetical protein